MDAGIQKDSNCITIKNLIVCIETDGKQIEYDQTRMGANDKDILYFHTSIKEQTCSNMALKLFYS